MTNEATNAHSETIAEPKHQAVFRRFKATVCNRTFSGSVAIPDRSCPWRFEAGRRMIIATAVQRYGIDAGEAEAAAQIEWHAKDGDAPDGFGTIIAAEGYSFVLGFMRGRLVKLHGEDTCEPVTLKQSAKIMRQFMADEDTLWTTFGDEGLARWFRMVERLCR